MDEQQKQSILSNPQGVTWFFNIGVSVDCVIFGFDGKELRVLVIDSDQPQFLGKLSLLGDIVSLYEELDDAAYRVLKMRTGLDDVYLEQVKAFSGVNRHPEGRVITIAFYSLINIHQHSPKFTHNNLHWQNVKDIKEMAFDHYQILQTCLKRLRRKIQSEPLAAELLPEKFSLRELQKLYEAILNSKLDRRNFRKKVLNSGFIKDLDEMESNVPHRPGKLYSFQTNQ